MKLNLSGWKKIGGDGKHTQLKNEKGHELKISHVSLSPKVRSQLQALPMADGGAVKDPISGLGPDKPGSGAYTAHQSLSQGFGQPSPEKSPDPYKEAKGGIIRSPNNPKLAGSKKRQDFNSINQEEQDDRQSVQKFAGGTPDAPVMGTSEGYTVKPEGDDTTMVPAKGSVGVPGSKYPPSNGYGGGGKESLKRSMPDEEEYANGGKVNEKPHYDGGGGVASLLPLLAMLAKGGAVPHYDGGGGVASLLPLLALLAKGGQVDSKEKPHYDDGGSVSQPAQDSPDQIANDAQSQAIAPVSNDKIPDNAAPPSGPSQSQDYGKIYQDAYQQIKAQHPGADDDFIRQAAMAQAQQAQNSDQGQAANTQQTAQAAAGRIDAEDQRRQKLGIPALPGGNPGAAAAPTNNPSSAQPGPSQPGLADNDPFGTQTYYDNYMEGLNKQKAGLAGQANVEGQMGNAQAAQLQHSISQQQDARTDYANAFNALSRERQNFQKDIENQHINPHQYMDSLSTGQRIGAAIGMIISGMGSGVTGQPNAAISYINDNINRDIAAQQANLGKKQNLLEANYKQFGNLRDAIDMTRVQMMDITSNQMKMAAAKLSNPMAQARLLQQQGVLDQQAAPIASQLAMRKTLQGGMASGKVAPESLIRMIVPPQQQDVTFKQLKEAQDAGALKDNTLAAFDQLAKINTAGNRMGSPIQSKAQVDAIRGAALDKLTKDTSGRVTPETVKLISGLFPGPGLDAKTEAIQRARLNDLLSQGMHYPLLKQWGINPENLPSRFDVNGRSKIPEAAPVLPKR